jgi:hypothetical protein
MNSLHDYVRLFPCALAVTVAIETAAIAAFFLLRRRRGLSRGLVMRVLVAGVVPSCVTLPLVWFVFPAILQNRILFLVAAELFAFVAEAPMIRGIVKTTWSEAVAASFLANGASFISGFLMGIS